MPKWLTFILNEMGFRKPLFKPQEVAKTFWKFQKFRKEMLVIWTFVYSLVFLGSPLEADSQQPRSTVTSSKSIAAWKNNMIESRWQCRATRGGSDKTHAVLTLTLEAVIPTVPPIVGYLSYIAPGVRTSYIETWFCSLAAISKFQPGSVVCWTYWKSKKLKAWIGNKKLWEKPQDRTRNMWQMSGFSTDPLTN